MIKIISLTVGTFALASGQACSQTGPRPPASSPASLGVETTAPQTTAEMGESRDEVAKHRAALLAQCPPSPGRLPEADAAKLPLHVTYWGTTGPRVLIVHGGVQGGLGGGPSTFARQKALAQLGWRLEVVDRPGFGQSPTRGVDDMEADSVWIADMLGSGANLIGHSWGGAEALLAAARRPEAVRSLILIEPALALVAMNDPRVRDDPAVKADGAKIGKLLMESRSPQEYGLSFARWIGTGPTPGDAGSDDSIVNTYTRDPEQAAKVGCALLRGNMAPAPAMRRAAEILAKAEIPVLIVSGGWSPSIDAIDDVVAKLTNGRRVTIRSPNHFVQFANANEFNTIVNDFMREAERTPRPAESGNAK